ncbi:Tll0287-like domain-containing protein [Pinirhizobacter sp.]|jgi:protein-histidine pros-kinase|uniref:Tll0287-like domain-containing protein n=1 Tax=Pinirhizobacter sp. TaxID=2950432 RepID=UPI002F427061
MLLRINLILLVAFALGMFAISLIVTATLQENATREVLAQAGLMMDSAAAIRFYTETEIGPLLGDKLASAFRPQSVPFYAATQNFLTLHKKHPEYSYKEATLNPTNPRDRATDWEADIVQRFRNDSGTRQVSGIRDTPMGRSLYLARPIRVDAGCLGCHSLPSAAPATMLARYGSDNGFGWQPNEVVGAQIVSVPFDSAQSSAGRVRRDVLIAIAAMLAGVWLVINASLYVLVIRPVRRIARIADQVSLGDTAAADFPSGGGPEVAALSTAFNRMRKSLDKALRMLGG